MPNATVDDTLSDLRIRRILQRPLVVKGVRVLLIRVQLLFVFGDALLQ